LADPLLPRGNRIVSNRISRATLGVHVFGAQTTSITNNTINITGSRTAILLTTATRPLDPGTQPINTEITGNQIISDGPCTVQFGCALRLFGVTVPVLAINNDWGLRTIQQVEGTIWHQSDDPLLGLATFVPFTNMVTSLAPSPGVTPTPVPTPTPLGGPMPTPTPGNGDGTGSQSTGSTTASQARPTTLPQPTGTTAAVRAASPTPSPAASTSSAAVTPSPSPTTSASALRAFSVSMLDMNQPCIPAVGQRACDPERLALWSGDATAWRARLQAQGRPAPSPDDIFVATLTFRIEAGEPAFKAAYAQAHGRPHLRINGARYQGQQANEPDEWIEVKNFGGGAQDMSGWSVRIPGTSIVWTFADGFVLEPGASCRFYAGTPGDGACRGSQNVASRGVLPNDQGVIELWVDYLDLLADRVSYSADPDNQPPPPNLQGVS
jgi:hypothetical protein